MPKRDTTPALNLALVEEYDATEKLVRKLRDLVDREPLLATKRGGDKMNPAATILAQQQTHLRGLARLLKQQGSDLPRVNDSELDELLG